MSYVLKLPQRFSLNTLINKLEFSVLVLTLLYFIGVRYPSLLSRFMNVGSYGILGLLIMLNHKRVVRVASQGFFLWAILVLAVVSVTWSVNPSVTMDTARGLIRTSLIGVYLAARYPFKEQIKLWYWVFGLATVFSLFSGLMFPQPNAWVGVFPQKNYLARIMALSAELFLLTCFADTKNRQLSFVCFLLAFIVLLLSQGKTSLVLFFAITILLPVIILLRQHYKLQVFVYLVSLLAFVAIAVLLLSNIELILVDILGKNLELNGRLPVWQLCIDKIQERPWLGYGYAAFWHSPESLYVTNNTWAAVGYLEGRSFNPHHGFIGIALSNGLVGVGLVVASMLSTFITVLKVLRFTGRIECLWMLQFLTFLLIFNLFDNAGLVSGRDALWTLYVSISFSAAIIWGRIKRDSLTANAEA